MKTHAQYRMTAAAFSQSSFRPHATFCRHSTAKKRDYKTDASDEILFLLTNKPCRYGVGKSLLTCASRSVPIAWYMCQARLRLPYGSVSLGNVRSPTFNPPS